MNTKHTPGPWRTTRQSVDGRYIEVSGRSHPIARVMWSTDQAGEAGTVEDHAHARLIAAAPETAAERGRLKEVNAALVEALVATLKHFRHPTSAEAKTRKLVVAAIAKARGEAV